MKSTKPAPASMPYEIGLYECPRESPECVEGNLKIRRQDADPGLYHLAVPEVIRV